MHDHLRTENGCESGFVHRMTSFDDITVGMMPQSAAIINRSIFIITSVAVTRFTGCLNRTFELLFDCQLIDSRRPLCPPCMASLHLDI